MDFACTCQQLIISSPFLFPNRNSPLALGENNKNLPRILQIFAEVFVHDILSDDETARKRVLSITRQIQVRPPAPASTRNMKTYSLIKKLKTEQAMVSLRSILFKKHALKRNDVCLLSFDCQVTERRYFVFIKSIEQFDLIEICSGTYWAYQRMQRVRGFVDFLKFSIFVLY